MAKTNPKALAWKAFKKHTGDSKAEFEKYYAGTYESEEEYARSYLLFDPGDMRNCPELFRYLDWQQWLIDAQTNDIDIIHHDGKISVFTR